MSWQEAATGVTAMVLAGVIATVVIVQLAATWRARMAVAREDAYQRLAEQATQAQQDTAARLAQLGAELTEVRERTSHLEGLLREVDEPFKR
jgi:hypothetical protein